MEINSSRRNPTLNIEDRRIRKPGIREKGSVGADTEWRRLMGVRVMEYREHTPMPEPGMDVKRSKVLYLNGLKKPSYYF